MSTLEDDIARGCLEDGQPIEAKWGTGPWSYQEPEQEPEPEFFGKPCPKCGEIAWWYGYDEDTCEFVECEACGFKEENNDE